MRDRASDHHHHLQLHVNEYVCTSLNHRVKLQQIAYKSTGWPTKLRSLSLTVHVFIMPEPICMNFGTTLCHLIIRETTDVFRKMMLKCTRNHANSFRHFEDVSSSGLGVLGHPVVHAQNTTKTELYYRQLYS